MSWPEALAWCAGFFSLSVFWVCLFKAIAKNDKPKATSHRDYQEKHKDWEKSAATWSWSKTTKTDPQERSK